jgi:hypothetical protein
MKYKYNIMFGWLSNQLGYPQSAPYYKNLMLKVSGPSREMDTLKAYKECHSKILDAAKRKDPTPVACIVPAFIAERLSIKDGMYMYAGKSDGKWILNDTLLFAGDWTSHVYYVSPWPASVVNGSIPAHLVDDMEYN